MCADPVNVSQVAANQPASHQAPALHILPTAVASPSQGSSLNVQNLYHLQLAQAPLPQPAMLNKSHPGRSLLHLTGHSEQDQQHHQQLGPADQLDQQQDLLNRLDDAEPGEASMPSPANTDYKHKPRRKATERPLVSPSQHSPCGRFSVHAAHWPAVQFFLPSTSQCTLQSITACCYAGASKQPNLSCMQGTDQIRQAFSKRKRGLALKCYQLHKLTDAKVSAFLMYSLRWQPPLFCHGNALEREQC